jgi:hypothetical protein
MPTPRQLKNKYQTLVRLQLLDGTVRLIQNWQPTPLVWRGNSYNYLDFPTPPLAKKIGEDAQSVILTLPNISVGQHGYLPIRDWIESGAIAGALFICYVFNDTGFITEHVFCVQEQEFDETVASAQIKLTLRQPDDKTVQVMTGVFSSRQIGEAVRTFS